MARWGTLVAVQATALVAAAVVFQPNTAHGGPPAKQRLQALSKADRNKILTTYLKQSGEPCGSVTRMFFQGTSPTGNDYWNVGCSNGETYGIQIKNDAEGSTKILNCRQLEAVGATPCFQKFQ